jgi:hypothetical protein
MWRLEWENRDVTEIYVRESEQKNATIEGQQSNIKGPRGMHSRTSISLKNG